MARARSATSRAQAPLPALPDDLAGWQWERHPNGTDLRLVGPAHTTKTYTKPGRAIAEARDLSESAKVHAIAAAIEQIRAAGWQVVLTGGMWHIRRATDAKTLRLDDAGLIAAGPIIAAAPVAHDDGVMARIEAAVGLEDSSDGATTSPASPDAAISSSTDCADAAGDPLALRGLPAADRADVVSELSDAHLEPGSGAPRADEAPAVGFWRALSHNHPTMHLWNKEGDKYRSACGIRSHKMPFGRADVGRCSKCAGVVPVPAGDIAPASDAGPSVAEQLRAHRWTWHAAESRGESGYRFHNEATFEVCWSASLERRLEADQRTPQLWEFIAAGWAPPPLGDSRAIFHRPPGLAEFATIPLAQIVCGRYQPRQDFDEQELQELADSIQQHGVIDPLVVFVNERGLFELVAGERRKRASERAGLDLMPARIIEADEAAIEKISVFENIQRANLSPLEEGAAFERLAKRMSDSEIARELGRPRSYIQQRRALAQAAPEVQEALKKGDIDFTRARAIIAGAPRDHVAQRRALKQLHEEQARGRAVDEVQTLAIGERAQLDRAKRGLKTLGWQQNTRYTNSIVVYAPGERPRVWTGAEIDQAIAEQRRPAAPASDDCPSVSEVDRVSLVHRGYIVTTGEFAPWIYLHGDGVASQWLHPTEIADAAARARTEIEEVITLFAQHGWSLEPDSNNMYCCWRVVSSKGRRESTYGWRHLVELLAKIEAGTQDDAPIAEKQLICEVCGAAHPRCDLRKRRLLCPDCRDKEQTAEQAAADARRAAIATAWRPWLEQAPIDLLQLLLCEAATTRRDLLGVPAATWMEHAEIARRVVVMERSDLAARIVEFAAHAGQRWPAWATKGETNESEGDN